MIWKIAYFGCALWFTGYIARLLYVAAKHGYVMALTNPFSDTVKARQTRSAAPQKFWANVIVALLLFPVGISGLYFSSSDLWQSLR